MAKRSLSSSGWNLGTSFWCALHLILQCQPFFKVVEIHIIDIFLLLPLLIASCVWHFLNQSIRNISLLKVAKYFRYIFYPRYWCWSRHVRGRVCSVYCYFALSLSLFPQTLWYPFKNPISPHDATWFNCNHHMQCNDFVLLMFVLSFPIYSRCIFMPAIVCLKTTNFIVAENRLIK